MALINEFRNDEAMRYEEFVLRAFELATGKRLKKGEDPAAFADTALFDDGELNKMKSAASYAMGIYIEYLYRNHNESSRTVCTYEDHSALQGYFDRVLAADCVEDVLHIVVEFGKIVKRFVI